MARVLIIDDDEVFSEMLSDMVMRSGHDSSKAFNLKDGVDRALTESFDVVFLDVRLPDGNGLELLPRIRESSSLPEIIILTGFEDPNGPELAIKNGAWDYIEKPSSIKEMTLTLIRALEYRDKKRSVKQPVALRLEGIVGDSPQMRACLDLVTQAALNGDANVLITGETGTGKELFAWAIHNNSFRSQKSFVVVDCAALPETLVESILFGHEKGAFTGADKVRDGLIRQAHGGTLFLDEIGELPMPLQKNFLRVLQEHRFRPVGAERETESDFRLICATNKDLRTMVQEKRFREDLLFRICTLTIDLPPLRERAEDIKELLIHYITRLCERYGIGIKGYSMEFLEALTAYEWPGNVREFVNAIERALSAAFHEPMLFPKHLPAEIRIQLKRSELSKNSDTQDIDKGTPDAAGGLPKLKDFREAAVADAEKQYLDNLMSITGHNIKEACRISGLSRPRLYALLKKLSLTKNH
ncbi:MAG: sigma-54 dependent transcriptional regulator [Syntrophorhabdaceae bacterium]|nr:sigma-54 dependent transcriptional regulator [Syntrophorhabdaceae bacterium]MDD5244154.1 sigma-54 dependent transcriptional regulator [Syntrophorhabdaceae bacterium]